METIYVPINTAKSRLLQLLSLLSSGVGVALLYVLRNTHIHFFLPLVFVFLATALTQLGRRFREEVEYLPPRIDAERRLLRRYKTLRNTSGVAIAVFLIAMEYSIVLRWGGGPAILIIGAMLFLSFTLLIHYIRADERFQRGLRPSL